MWTFRKSRCWNGVWPVHGEVLASGWEAMLQVHAVWKAKLTKDQCPESHWKCSLPRSFQLQLWPLQENIQDQKGSVQPCVYGAQILKNCDELFIRLLRSVYFVIIRSNIIKSLAFTVFACIPFRKQRSVSLLGPSFPCLFKKVKLNFHGGWIPPYKGQKEASGKAVELCINLRFFTR